jgi:hypothetical protein
MKRSRIRSPKRRNCILIPPKAVRCRQKLSSAELGRPGNCERPTGAWRSSVRRHDRLGLKALGRGTLGPAAAARTAAATTGGRRSGASVTRSACARHASRTALTSVCNSFSPLTSVPRSAILTTSSRPSRARLSTQINGAPVMGISASQAVAPSGNVALIYSKAAGLVAKGASRWRRRGSSTAHG